MLKKISCSKFKDKNGQRHEIIFHEGLNIVLGTDKGKNSIGKTTLLMIIDFVFGGIDYCDNKERNDVWLNVKEHTIDFEFEFNNKTYKFSRSFENDNLVTYHNINNGKDELLSLKEYNKRLQILYGLDKYHISFRDAVGPFFRVYGRQTLDPNLPLASATKEKLQSGLDRLIKLFNLFENIDGQKSLYEKAKDDLDGINKGIKYTGIKKINSNKEQKEYLLEIEKLQNNLNELEKNSNAGLLDLDSVETEHLTDIGLKMSALRKQKTYLTSQIKSLKETKSAPINIIKDDFKELASFFDNINLKKIRRD